MQLFVGMRVNYLVDGQVSAMVVRGFDDAVVVLGTVGNGQCIIVKRQYFDKEMQRKLDTATPAERQHE